MFMRNHLLSPLTSFSLVLLLALLISQSVSAAVDPPAISSAQIHTPSAGKLTITGTNFGTTKPVVKLAGTSLFVPPGFTDNQIVLALPAHPTGNYQLTVTNTTTDLVGSFIVTIAPFDFGFGVLRVVDKLGREVGFLDDQQSAIRYVDLIKRWLRFRNVTKNGFEPQYTALIYYVTTNCSGTGYFASEGDDSTLIQNAYVYNGKVYYPKGIYAQKVVRSARQNGQASTCAPPFTATRTVVPYATFLVSNLGLTPPFRVVR